MSISSVDQLCSIPSPNSVCEMPYPGDRRDVEIFFAILCEQNQLPLPSLTFHKDGKRSAVWSATDVSSFQQIYPDAIRIHSAYFQHYIQVLNEAFKSHLPVHSHLDENGPNAFVNSVKNRIDAQGVQAFQNRCCNLPCRSITIDRNSDSTRDTITILYEDEQPRWEPFGFHQTFGRMSITETGIVTYENNHQLNITITGSATSFIRHDIPLPPPREPEYDPFENFREY